MKLQKDQSKEMICWDKLKSSQKWELTVTQREPAAGRSDEGAADGDDRTESEGDPGLVPEQAVQGNSD